MAKATKHPIDVHILANETVKTGNTTLAVRALRPDLVQPQNTAYKMGMRSDYQQALQAAREKMFTTTDTQEYFNDLKKLAKTAEKEETRRKALLNVLDYSGMSPQKVTLNKSLTLKTDDVAIMARLDSLLMS